MKMSYEEKLLADWEDVFRQGLLTFWIFVALDKEELDVQGLKQRIGKLTDDAYSAADQTLYRVLRKHYELELVDFREVPGSGGPPRKLYRLSTLGERLLRKFTARNILLFEQAAVQRIYKNMKG
jgi:DNA-binding PadR family transcriptional regulator